MASIKIYEDQENLQQQQPTHLKNKFNAQQQGNGGNQKRTVLGVRNTNKLENINNNKALKPKQALQVIETTKNPLSKNTNNENQERNPLNSVNIPVAQFEAIKFYEDEAKYAKIEERLKAKSTSNIYKGTAEDRFVTKREVAEMERQGLIPAKIPQNYEIPSTLVDDEDDDDADYSPMSIEQENDFKENHEFILTQQQQQQTQHHQQQDDFFFMEEYSMSIYEYLREHELRNRPKPTYMSKQPDLTPSMRAILVDWLVEVTEEYKLHSETLYLAVNYIDRFLSYMSVVRVKLQLVGTSAMFIASKYEEIYPPDIGEFVYITDDTYTKRQVIRMENLIVKVLQYELSAPTPLAFLNAICTINKLEEKVKFLAMFLCELSLLEGETYLEFLPSQLATSAIIIARFTLDNSAVWNETLQKNTGYELFQLTDCIQFLYLIFVKAPTNPQHAIQDKFNENKYLQVSKQSAPTLEQFNKLLEKIL